MKKFTITIIFYFISTIIFGQNFTLSELIKINNYQLDDFDTYVTQKGYKYFETDNTDISDETTYVFYVNGVKKSYITKFYYKTQTKEQRIELLRTHLTLFEKTWKEIHPLFERSYVKSYPPLKRFFKIYINGFEGASYLREKLMLTQNVEEANKVLEFGSPTL